MAFGRFTPKATHLLRAMMAILLWVVPVAAGASPLCGGVGVVGPSGNGIIEVANGGSTDCVVTADGALTFTGYFYAGEDFVSSGTTTYTYDLTGDLVTEVGPQSTTTFVYDAADRLIRDTESTIRTTYTYDQQGLIVKSETASESTPDTPLSTTQYVYDDVNRLIRSETSGQTTTYTYDDSSGRLTTINYADGTVTSYKYDPQGRLKEVDTTIDPQTTYETFYTYDDMGRLVEIAQPSALLADDFFYDEAGRVTHTDTHSNGNVTNVTTYTYDPANRLSTDTDPSGTTRFAYTAAPVPEPTTVVLFTTGLIWLGVRHRRGSNR